MKVPGASDPAETLNLSFELGGRGMDEDDDYHDALVAQILGLGFAGDAGNDGPDRTPSTPSAAISLSVGAYSDLNTVATADDVITTFSSRGPTPGGRKKPDLIAPGVGIIAPDADWEGASADFTSVSAGTSFSAPFVAGGMALLGGAGDHRPARCSARSSSTRPATWMGQTHWQPDAGWGALDLGAAFAQRANFADRIGRGRRRALLSREQATGGKTTLAWERRGVWGSFPDCCLTAYTVTNLDLRQYVGIVADRGSAPDRPPPRRRPRRGRSQRHHRAGESARRRAPKRHLQGRRRIHGRGSRDRAVRDRCRRSR